MRSHLLEGTVRHRRSKTTSYALEHAVYYFALDLDELDEVTRRVPLVRRIGPASSPSAMPTTSRTEASDVAAEVRAHLRGPGLHRTAGRSPSSPTCGCWATSSIRPASTSAATAVAGCRTVIVEVHNTHGERHLYTLRPAGAEGEAFSASMDKDFYVSPFISSEGRYHVTVRDEPDGVRIGINLRQERELVLATSLVLARRRLSRAASCGCWFGTRSSRTGRSR